MRFREFAGRVQEKVGILCGEGYRLRIENIRKNNGMVRRGMSIRKEGGDSGSVIYLDSYYEYYKKGEMSLETAAEEIYKAFVRSETPAELREMLKDFKKIRNRVVCRLVNRERNKALLEDIPWAHSAIWLWFSACC